jgi:hypothetical protein
LVALFGHLKLPLQPFIAVLQGLDLDGANPVTFLHHRDDHVGSGVENIAATAAGVGASWAVMDRSDKTAEGFGDGVAVLDKSAHNGRLAVALTRYGACQRVDDDRGVV